MAETITSYVSLGIAIASILLVVWDHFKDDRLLKKRVQSFYENIEGLIFSWYQIILNQEKFKEDNVNTLYEEIFFKYQKKNTFYRGIVDQSFEDLSKYLGLTYFNKPHYYYSNDNEYFIKHTGSVHKFTRQSNQFLPSPAVCFFDEGYTKIVIDDDNITIINNFLENLRNHWNTYYYKRILRKKLKPNLDFSDLLNSNLI